MTRLYGSGGASFSRRQHKNKRLRPPAQDISLLAHILLCLFGIARAPCMSQGSQEHVFSTVPDALFSFFCGTLSDVSQDASHVRERSPSYQVSQSEAYASSGLVF